MAGEPRAVQTQVPHPQIDETPPEQLPQLRLITPVRGYEVEVGKKLVISWENAAPGTLRIYLTRNLSHKRSGYTLIATAEGATGQYVWTVEAPASTACYVMIVDAADSMVAMAYPFLIKEAPPPVFVTGETLANLIDQVNLRLDNRVEWGKDVQATDGSKTAFFLPDRFIREVDDPTDPTRLRCWLTTTDFTGEVFDSNSYGPDFDYDSSWYTFMVPPPQGSARWSYTFQRWSRKLVKRMLNAAVTYCFPQFYAIHTRDYPVEGREYIIDNGGSPAEGILSVQLQQDDIPWQVLSPHRHFRVLRGEYDECRLSLFFTPTEDTLRVRAAYRPLPFETEDQTLGDIGLPDYCAEALILYACWQLLAQKLAARTRFDQAITPATVTMRDHLQASQMYQALFQMEISKRRMRPWTARGI